MLPVTLPEGFDPGRDTALLEAKVRQLKGAEWALASIDTAEGRAYFTSRQSVTTIIATEDRKGARLPADVRPSDGAKQAVLLAQAFDIKYPGQGWVMTEFDPYRREAVMERLNPMELRAREALATALGVKPWEVGVRQADDQGFDVRLPASYTPSKHDRPIDEAVTGVIGRPGWYTRADAAALTMKIRPGELPTFPATVPYPFEAATSGSWRPPLGLALGSAGEPNRALSLDFDGTPGMLVTGTAGSGKSVFLNGLISSALARGWEMAIADVPHKAVDFLWCKDLCRPGGWGCDSKAQALTVLALAYEEGQRRARLLRQHGVQKLQELPDEVRPAPILIVVDEVTGLFALEPVPKGVPKDHPLVMETLEKNLVTQTLISIVGKIPAEMRFVGIRIILSTQMAQANTGVSVPLRMNLANRVLLGANPNDTARGHALLDPRSVPRVPEWIRADAQVSRGVGVAELEGQEPCVFKGFYASTEQLRAWLDELGVPVFRAPEPTVRDMKRLAPSLDGGQEAYDLGDESGGLDDSGLSGAARATHELAVSAANGGRG